jgi:hypothetical protein
MHRNVWLESLKGRDHSEDLDIDSKVKLSRYMPWRHMEGKGGIAPTHT